MSILAAAGDLRYPHYPPRRVKQTPVNPLAVLQREMWRWESPWLYVWATAMGLEKMCGLAWAWVWTKAWQMAEGWRLALRSVCPSVWRSPWGWVCWREYKLVAVSGWVWG